MGCFLGCLGGSKDRKIRNQQRHKLIPPHLKNGTQQPLQTNVPPEQSILEKPTNQVSHLRDKVEEQLSSSTRKRVTFDSNVRTYEHVSSVYESTDSLPETDKIIKEEKEESLAKPSQSHSVSEDDSVISSLGSYPSNHRYQNCRDSDDEAEELDYEDGNLDGEDDNEGEEDEEELYGDYDEELDHRMVVGKEVWSESILTESMESRTDNISAARVITEEVDSPMAAFSMAEQEVNSIGVCRTARDRTTYVYPVLNPVENVTQWKALKSKGTSSLKPQKENYITDIEPLHKSFSSESSCKQSSLSFKSRVDQPKALNQEIAVDASLSNWLVTPEATSIKKTSYSGLETIASEKSMSQGSNSVISIEDRPILGALTIEELKQLSASSSPRSLPRLDEMPIVGTVGTYWNHTDPPANSGSAFSDKGIPNTTSKYREDKKVTWYATPFETRLESALNRGAAELSSSTIIES